MSIMISVLIVHISIDFCLYMMYIAAVMNEIFLYKRKNVFVTEMRSVYQIVC